MKKGLLGTTALVGAGALAVGVAGAAEAPTWKLSGNVNFQIYAIDQDSPPTVTSWVLTPGGTFVTTTKVTANDNGYYFGVDEAELKLTVSGTADNGLNYGFKIELNANTSDGDAADEVRLQLSGGWGTLQLGDEDGAEDIMNYGGENLMGATGGFDGDQDDWYVNIGAATSFPSLAGDTSDHTKISYFSPRFSGLQLGVSLTPNTGADGDEGAFDQGDENHIGVGVNYDNSFGGIRIRASAVYSSDTDRAIAFGGPFQVPREDTAAWSVGSIVGFGPFSVAANYTDNDDSDTPLGSGDTWSHWNAAASFETGPMYFSVGYLDSIYEFGGSAAEDTYTHIALTADYTVAPGLSVYAEFAAIESETGALSNEGTGVTLGVNVSF